MSNHSVTEKQKLGKRKMTRAEQAQRTSDRILKTAIKLFAAKGYDGVSVDEVVKAAKVNKRMVYHYYGDKAGLYAAVLAKVYSRLAEVEADVFRDKPSVATALEGIVRAYFQFLQTTPEFVSLLLWENLQGGAHLKNLGEALSKAPILEALSKVIEEGITTRQIRADIDRRHLLIHLFGLCQIYFSNRHTLKRSVGLNLDDPKVLEEGIASVIALLKSGIAPSDLS